MPRSPVLPVWSCLPVILALAAPSAFCQRAASTATKTPGKKAAILYQQNFDDDGALDNFQENAAWCDDPLGAFGSKGSLKISGDRPDAGAERYMKWTNDDTTVAFMFYAHGAKTAYFLAKGEKAGKNLHAYFPIKEQDAWQTARIKADSLVGFGGGASSPGETFKNLVFFVEEWDKGTDRPYLLIDNIVIFSGEDGQPPSAGPSKLEVNWYADHGAASLNWAPASDDVGVFVYEVHRSEEAGFEPTRKTRIARISDNYYEDHTVEAGKTYYYRAVAEDAGGFTVASDAVAYQSEHAGTPAGKGEF